MTRKLFYAMDTGAIPALLALTAFAQDNPSPDRPVLKTAAPASAQEVPTWKSKQIADWREEDAKQVINDSPWVKTFTPTLGPAQSSADRGRMSGIGMGGVGIGMPGMGRRMGGGYPGGFSQGGHYPGGQTGGSWPN